MPTKPNMRMGGVDTQGDRGVMGAAMQTANIKANAEKDNGLSAVAGQLSDWADQEMQDSRRQALEARAEARGIAKEGRVAEREAGLLEASNTRQDKLTGEKREYDAPLRDAQVRQANAAARKSDRWEANATSKTDAKDSLYTVNGKAINIGQAKQAYKEFENMDPELVAQNRAAKTEEVVKYLDDKGMNQFWTTKSDAEDFVALYEIDPAAAKKEDAKAYKTVDEALEDYKTYSGFQDFLDKKYTGTTDTATKDSAGRPVRGANESKEDYLNRLKAMRGK